MIPTPSARTTIERALYAQPISSTFAECQLMITGHAPRASPLYQCLRRHGDELDAAGLIHRPVEGQVLERFMACGDLHHGFARVYCDQCGDDYLLAYSCKTRYFCPSCHQKRMLAYGEWLEENLLAPVPHRQYVFTWPVLVRPCFRYRRRYLGEPVTWSPDS